LLIAATMYAAVVAVAASIAARDRVWNFDAVGYVAAALAWSVDDDVELHRAVYTDLETALPKAAFKSVARGSKYREGLYRDPVALRTQVPFYANKPGYVAAVALLSRLGLSAATATRVVSVLAYIAVAALVLAWLVTARAGPAQIVAAAAVMCAPPMIEMAALSSPDMFGLVPVVAGTWIMFRGRPLAGLIVAAAVVLVRPDMGILPLCLVLWCATFAPPEQRLGPRAAAAIGATVVLLSLAISKLAGGPDLQVVWQHTWGTRLDTPAQMTDAMPWSEYARILGRHLSGDKLKHPSVIWLHLALAAAIAASVMRPSNPDRRPFLAWMLAVWAYVPLHYLVFPERADRFFAPAYVLSAAAGLAHWFDASAQRRPAS
jgi:hypothetical protein